MIQNQIMPWLLQCDLDGAKEALKSRRFDLIVTAAFNVRVPYPEESIALILPVNDHDDVPGVFFDLAALAARTHLGDVLVHCNGGRNRSVAFAAAIAYSLDFQPFDVTFERANSSPTKEVMAALVRWRERTAHR